MEFRLHCFYKPCWVTMFFKQCKKLAKSIKLRNKLFFYKGTKLKYCVLLLKFYFETRTECAVTQINLIKFKPTKFKKTLSIIENICIATRSIRNKKDKKI